MSRYDVTSRAKAELLDIFLYGYERFGESTAHAYAKSFGHIFQLLADTPGMGRKADSISPGVRRHEHRSHVILYEEATFGVVILAVVHGRSVRRLAL